MTIAIEIIGWTGAALILLAYALISTNRLEVQSHAYQLMNVLGAIAFIVNSGWNGAYPSAALNVAWMGIGMYSLLRLRGRRT